MSSDAARAGGARLLCVYSTADLAGAGLQRREGYRRLTAADAPAGDQLPVLDVAAVRGVWPRSFIGQWGHHLIAPADHEAIADAVFVGLPEGERWLGICRVSPAAGSSTGRVSPTGPATRRRGKPWC